METYSVNGKGFNSFMAAVAEAKAVKSKVIQNDNGMVRSMDFSTPSYPAKRRTRHILIQADGTEVEFKGVCSHG